MEDYNQMSESRSAGTGSNNFLYASTILGAPPNSCGFVRVHNDSNNNGGGGNQMAVGGGFHGQCSDHASIVKTESSAHYYNSTALNLAQKLRFSFQGGAEASSATEAEAIKAKIIAHPQYTNILEAYMDCQKIGAPPEVVTKLAAVRQEFESRHRSSSSTSDAFKDPELDQFMEGYYDMLVKYREELTRPLQEAMDFMRRVETQLNMLTNAPVKIFNTADNEKGSGEGGGGGGGSSEEEQDNMSGGETEGGEIDPRAEDRELKNHLLRKYSGYLSSLKQELSKKKKKGKLPKEARQKLLTWWELHYKWPYPSETEKVALAESTGLDQKQINNWFINQRKRHWKPSEDMQFMVMDGLHPGQNLYMDGSAAAHYMSDGPYRLGP